MAVVTIYRLAEEILKILNGGEVQLAANVSINEMKISIGQVANSVLKIDYMAVNGKAGEAIPNGSVLGTYEGIAVTKTGTNKSEAVLPIKPIKLPRNMGIFSVWQTDKPEQEFIPVQMGQMRLLKSQPLINNLLGQVAYENVGKKLLFNKDLTEPGKDITVDMQLVIMDISQYGDYDMLPILPEQEWQIKQEVIKLYSQVPIGDRVVDSTTKELQGLPLKQQQQS